MIQFLQKIAWATRKWNFKFNLLDIYLHDGDGCWGFSFCEIVKDFRPYSLLAIEFRLPNGAERTKVQITNWDFFYLSTPIYNWMSNLSESILWGYKPTAIESIGLIITKKMFGIW